MQFQQLAELAAKAWSKTKSESDPEFNQCDITHKERLVAKAQGVVDTQQAFDGLDAVMLRLFRESQEEKSEVEKIVQQFPSAHADEVMHMAAGLPHPLKGHAEDRQRGLIREEFRGVEPFTANPVHLESRSMAVIEPLELSDPEVMGTISVDPEAKPVTVNVESVKPRKSKKKGK